MKTLWILLLAAPVFAQNAIVAQGEKLFAANCSVPYCHGANGTAGRAPRLIGHGFTDRQLRNTISNGIVDKGMPAFGKQLAASDLDAVIAYLATLRGNVPAAAAADVAAESPGKALFFDAVRMGGCGRCHELEKRGSAVAPPMENIPGDLRAVGATHIVTVSAKGDAAFPAVVVERSGKRVRVYDLSSRLPVLRSFAGGAVEVTAGSSWQHRDATAGYTDAELREIAAYLRTASK